MAGDSGDEGAVGFLAAGVDAYAECIVKVLAASQTDRERMASAARQKSLSFSNARFSEGWLQHMKCVLAPQ